MTAPDWVDLPGAAQAAQIRRTVTRAGRKSVEVVYLITSADHHVAPPATLAAWVQGHWTIENQPHRVRDGTVDEDRSQIRTGNAPRVMATVRNATVRNATVRNATVRNATVRNATVRNATVRNTVIGLLLVCA